MGKKGGTRTLSIMLRISNCCQSPLAIFNEHGYDIVPVWILRVRARPLPVELHPERRYLFPPKFLPLELGRSDNNVLLRLGVSPMILLPLALFKERLVLHLECSKCQRPLGPLGKVLGRVLPEVGAEPVLAPAGWLVRIGCSEGETAGRLADRLPDFALRFVAQTFEQSGATGEMCAGPEYALGW